MLPSASPEQVVEQLPRLFDKLDMYSYSASFLLALLTCPSDGKADNFMARRFLDGRRVRA